MLSAQAAYASDAAFATPSSAYSNPWYARPAHHSGPWKRWGSKALRRGLVRSPLIRAGSIVPHKLSDPIDAACANVSPCL